MVLNTGIDQPGIGRYLLRQSWILFGGSLMPIKIVDGGTLLKWTLIDKGWTVEAADGQVRRATVGTGVVVGVTALVDLVLRRMRHG